VSKWEI